MMESGFLISVVPSFFEKRQPLEFYGGGVYPWGGSMPISEG